MAKEDGGRKWLVPVNAIQEAVTNLPLALVGIHGFVAYATMVMHAQTTISTKVIVRPHQNAQMTAMLVQIHA